MIGVLGLRDQVFDRAHRDTFDTPYEFTLKSLFSARDSMRQLANVWQEHERAVATGQIARSDRHGIIRVDATVDRELGQEAEAFINAAARCAKKGMQDIAALLGADIGFLFQKQPAFEAGLERLRQSDPALADYVAQARTRWSESLQAARNAVEHNGWTLPAVRYSKTPEGIRAAEPVIEGKPATQFASFVFDRLACFVEEVTAHLLARKLPAHLVLSEVPRNRRPADKPERFKLSLATGGLPPWSLLFHPESFEDS